MIENPTRLCTTQSTENIKKQERHTYARITIAEQDAHANGLKKTHKKPRVSFNYDPLNGSFAKRIVQVLNRNQTMCSGIAALTIYPCAKGALNVSSKRLA